VVDIETKIALREQEQLQEWMSHPGTKIVADRLRRVARSTLLKQTRLSPYTNADDIVKCQQLRYVINNLIPQIVEDIVNFEEQSPTKQLEGNKRWSFMSWLKGVFSPCR
jgi:hypothetical protein